MYDQSMFHWKFDGKEDFLKQAWTKYKEIGDDGSETTTYLYKKSSNNFEWIRILTDGHMILFDSPDL